MDLFDVIIVGGGPAGLNAAVVLGRCNRKVLLFDHRQQRNRYSHGMHNYLTRDDISPSNFLKICRDEVKKYGVKSLNREVKDAQKTPDEIFEVKDEKDKVYHAKKMILATGLTDTLPDIKGTKQFYGKSLYHCPYCDGWENNGKKIGLYAKKNTGVDLAITLSSWSDDITLYTDGDHNISKKNKKQLDKHKIQVNSEKIAVFTGRGGKIKTITFQNGGKAACEALFFSNGYSVQCHLVESLGCKTGKNQIALANQFQQTNIPGLYVAGDVSKDIHFVVVAAAEGAKAGVYINKELTEEATAST
ncbi:MAG: NAD(P)/FAD-dependent oxidoreductase [Ginsengibacter sp.]